MGLKSFIQPMRQYRQPTSAGVRHCRTTSKF